MKRLMSLLALLLAVPVVFAASERQSDTACYGPGDCVRLSRTTSVQCIGGLVPDPTPECVRGHCAFCKSPLIRPKADCRTDQQCAQNSCIEGKFPRCVGSKCVCATKIGPECISDNDCNRPLRLNNQYRRMICQRGKCAFPKPLVTMFPRSSRTSLS